MYSTHLHFLLLIASSVIFFQMTSCFTLPDSGPGNQLSKPKPENSTVSTETPLSETYPLGFFENSFHSNKSNVNSSTSEGQKQLLNTSAITGSKSTTGHVPSNYSVVNGTNAENVSSQSNAKTENTSSLNTIFDVVKSWSASDTAVHSRGWLVLTKVTEINKVEEIREDPENNNQKRVINETRREQLKIVRDREVYEDDVYNDLENIPELSFE
ncbi:uncharacterized protein LOC118179287 [Stegodyphus dumicola]|uniref:uncharacterized protein LOC118179287 n=1 Tax=Stegodyphus dumicola TaxID=202533 RepID=UPI0015ABA3A2|nr:uncharacterized protein LOC118179287 [Stegodyphus dumicola]